MPAVVIGVIGTADGTMFGTPLFVRGFDPDAPAGPSTVEEGGYAIRGAWGGLTVITKDRDQAMRFANAAEALALWKTQSAAAPLRPDRRPNRPMTALSVEIIREEDL